MARWNNSNTNTQPLTHTHAQSQTQTVRYATSIGTRVICSLSIRKRSRICDRCGRRRQRRCIQTQIARDPLDAPSHCSRTTRVDCTNVCVAAIRIRLEKHTHTARYRRAHTNLRTRMHAHAHSNTTLTRLAWKMRWDALDAPHSTNQPIFSRFSPNHPRTTNTRVYVYALRVCVCLRCGFSGSEQRATISHTY